MKSDKIRVIKDFEKLEQDIQEQIKLTYPAGFSQHLITFTDKEGKYVSALPFETEEKYYLVRMNVQTAKAIIEDDDDYDEDGFLKDEAREEYEDKYSDKDFQFDEEEPEDDNDDF
ncbi:MAG: hypothetical protein JXR52_02340 [Bacteroidales bacterium]|nr:hypothetical protein [Bacteroidales bacterium]MBN2697640.1 hypothetical protein [Bacteroidales bacterium]